LRGLRCYLSRRIDTDGGTSGSLRARGRDSIVANGRERLLVEREVREELTRRYGSERRRSGFLMRWLLCAGIVKEAREAAEMRFAPK
jgi:hypothetical protein